MRIQGSRGAEEILNRVREVLLAVLDNGNPDWPDLPQWQAVLPTWFVTACAPERTREDSKRWLAWWRTLDQAAKAEAESKRSWSLANWLHWLMPDERVWYWWDVIVEPDDVLCVMIEAVDWPTPFGALEWLLRTAGAESISRF